MPAARRTARPDMTIDLGRKELNEMIQEAKPVELKCHFCNSAYEFSTEDLKELLRKSK